MGLWAWNGRSLSFWKRCAFRRERRTRRPAVRQQRESSRARSAMRTFMAVVEIAEGLESSLREKSLLIAGMVEECKDCGALA